MIVVGRAATSPYIFNQGSAPLFGVWDRIGVAIGISCRSIVRAYFSEVCFQRCRLDDGSSQRCVPESSLAGFFARRHLDPGVLLKDPGVLLKAPGVLLKETPGSF